VEVPAYSGRVTVFFHFDAFLRDQPAFAPHVLDIFARASWNFLVDGGKFLTFVQSDDPRIELDPLGCRHAIWNMKEWFNKDRGV
jgi:hypothetical protein